MTCKVTNYHKKRIHKISCQQILCITCSLTVMDKAVPDMPNFGVEMFHTDVQAKPR